MNKQLTSRDLRNAILFAALVYLVIKFVSLIISIILVLFISVLFAMLLNPAVSFLNKHKISRQFSASFIAIFVIVTISLSLYLLIPPAGDQLMELWRKFSSNNLNDTVIANKLPNNILATLKQYVTNNFTPDSKTISNIAGYLLGGASKLSASTFAAITGLFLIFVMTIYMLANPEPLTKGVLNAISPNLRLKATSAGEKIYIQVKAWAAGVLAGMVSIFLLTWIGLTIIGMKQAFLFAVIAGFLEAVPIVGPIMSAVPPMIAALIQQPILALWVALLFLIIQQVEGNLLIPLIMSRQLSLHPVTVIASVMVMGGFFGIVGVFLATPTVMVAGVIYDEFFKRKDEEIFEDDCKDIDDEKIQK